MNKQKNEKRLDELISHTINTEKPQFDAEKWKQKYPEQFQLLKSRAAKIPTRQVNIWTRTIQSPISKLAAAAVIILAIGLFAVHRGQRDRFDSRIVSEVSKSPAEMLTVASLKIAYRQGGMEAVEKQYEKASEMRGAKPTEISLQELLAEFNGT